MAILSKTGIETGQVIEASQVSQSIDALTGAVNYDISINGSLNVTGSTTLSGSGIVIKGGAVSITSSNFNATLTQGILNLGYSNNAGIIRAGTISASYYYVSQSLNYNILTASSILTTNLTASDILTTNLTASNNITANNISASSNLVTNSITASIISASSNLVTNTITASIISASNNLITSDITASNLLITNSININDNYDVIKFQRAITLEGSGPYNFSIIKITSSLAGINGTPDVTGSGIFIDPVATSIINNNRWRSIQWNNDQGYGLYGSGSALNYIAGPLEISNNLTSSNLLVINSITANIISASSNLVTNSITASIISASSNLVTNSITASIISASSWISASNIGASNISASTALTASLITTHTSPNINITNALTASIISASSWISASNIGASNISASTALTASLITTHTSPNINITNALTASIISASSNLVTNTITASIISASNNLITSNITASIISASNSILTNALAATTGDFTNLLANNITLYQDINATSNNGFVVSSSGITNVFSGFIGKTGYINKLIINGPNEWGSTNVTRTYLIPDVGTPSASFLLNSSSLSAPQAIFSPLQMVYDPDNNSYGMFTGSTIFSDNNNSALTPIVLLNTGSTQGMAIRYLFSGSTGNVNYCELGSANANDSWVPGSKPGDFIISNHKLSGNLSGGNIIIFPSASRKVFITSSATSISDIGFEVKTNINRIDGALLNIITSSGGNTMEVQSGFSNSTSSFRQGNGGGVFGSGYTAIYSKAASGDDISISAGDENGIIRITGSLVTDNLGFPTSNVGSDYNGKIYFDTGNKRLYINVAGTWYSSSAFT